MRETLMEKAKDSILEIDEDMAAEVLEEAKAEGITARYRRAIGYQEVHVSSVCLPTHVATFRHKLRTVLDDNPVVLGSILAQ